MPDQNDPLSSLASAIYKPIQQSEPTFNPRPVQPSGWEGKTGQIANLATNFLAGVSKGRAQAYDREQQNQMRQVASIQTAIKAVDESGASDEVKKQQKTQLLRMMGELVRGSLPDSTKGKKGGEADAQQPNGHPMLHAMKGMLDSMLGPPPKKSDITPEMIQAQLGQVFTTINDQKNSQSAFTQQLEGPFNALYAQKVKANGGPLTYTQIVNDPELKAQMDQVAAKNAGSLPSGVANTIAAGQTLEKEHQATALQKMKDDAAAAKETAAENARVEAQNVRDTGADKRQREREDAEDKRAREREDAETKRAREREAHEDARAAQRTGGGGGTNDPKEIAAGIREGSLPPELTRLYGKASSVEAELHRQGYNLVAAQRDWDAVKKHISTLNGPQQTRIIENVNALSEMVPRISDAYDAWLATGLPGGYRAYNKASLLAATQLPGEKGKAAQNLLTYINDAVSETGQIYMGGNSPTDHALQMAQTNLQGDWNETTFKSSLDILKSNIAIRRNSILNSPVIGADPTSPYIPTNQRDQTGQAQPVTAGNPYNGKTANPPQQSRAQQPAQGTPAPPTVGTIVKGHRFKGGDPADQSNWEKVPTQTAPPPQGQRQDPLGLLH